MTPRFLQLHLLSSYPAALLNRDDAGFAKRLPFGGAIRTRISSQCLKRHWRTFEGEGALSGLGVEMAVRSRLSFQKYVYEPLVAGGMPSAVAEAATTALMKSVLGQSAKAKGKASGDQPSELETSQLTVLGRPELRWMLGEVEAACRGLTDPKEAEKAVGERFAPKEAKKNLQALQKAAAGLDAALFGRMVTSDILSRGDASVHVAHAFTVHKDASESDYFSAVDDLLAEGGELGSAHINSMELTSGLYYTYLAIDLPLLVSNLEGCERKAWLEADRTLAAKVAASLARLAATVSPGAKLGSTAPHAYALLVLAELGSAQPRTLANAFMKPVAEAPDLLANTYAALAAHVRELDDTYGRAPARALAGLGPLEPLLDACGLEKKVSLDVLTAWLEEEVQGAGRAVAAV